MTDPETMAKKMSEALGTRVRIFSKLTRDGGSLQIEYTSEEDLNRIYELLVEEPC